MAQRPAFGLTVLFFLLTRASLATTPNDLCPAADPCTIDHAVTIDPDADLDFGDRTLQITGGAIVSWSSNLTLRARRIELGSDGALVEVAPTPTRGFLTLHCESASLAGKILNVGAGVLVADQDGTPGPTDALYDVSGQIQVKNDQESLVAIDVFGPITFSGTVATKAKGPTPVPGQLRFYSTFGAVTVAESARIKLRRAVADPFSELVWLEAPSATLTVDGVVDASAKAGAWAFDFEADGDVAFGPKSKVVAKGKNGHAQLGINSQGGNVTLRGKILASANVPITDPNGIGVCAAGDIAVDGGAQINGKSKSGGTLVFGAGGHVTVGTVTKGAKLLQNQDTGDTELCADGGVSVTNTSKVVPAPDAIGTGCLSANSPTLFDLDCNH